MKPALTAEEWAGDGAARYEMRGIAIVDDGGATTVDMGTSALSFVGKERHALAALALYRQPFGFTREDVKWLDAVIRTNQTSYQYVASRDPAVSLRGRVEDLLPPEASNAVSQG